MKMPKSMNDVRLTDGQGYFVEDGPYQYHLERTVENAQVSYHYIE
jgi:hypothetical protein